VSDFQARSFDAPRQRSVPREFVGVTPAGEERRVDIRRMTLVVAVKPDCDGCREFINGELDELSGVDVVIVSATSSTEWADATNEVLIGPAFMKVLDIRSAPFYVLIDPSTQRVVTEGVVFGPSQVAAEIANALER
jgi:hypothetical protein